jgi:putative DNA primase/helicase
MTAAQFDAIPAELTATDRWVAWRHLTRDGKETKVPFCAAAPTRQASSTDPATWTSFGDACAAVVQHDFAGPGFVLGDGYAGIDLDGCRNPQTGSIHPAAFKTIAFLDSYTEVSPSGCGVKVYMRGTLPPGRRETGTVPWAGYVPGAKEEIALWDRARYFAVTGEHLLFTPREVRERTDALHTLHARLFPAAPATNGAHHDDSRPVDLGDVALVERAMAARNGDRFKALWFGDIGGHDSHSEADQALCNHLAFWCGGDAGRVDALFRQSGLMRDKWEQREDYRTRTIERAVTDCREFYEPHGHGRDEYDPSRYRAEPQPDEPGADDTGSTTAGVGRRPLTLRRLLEGAAPEPPQMQTENLLLASDINVFGGGGDAGKTTSMLSAAVNTPIGRRQFGSLAVRQPGPVVLVVPEDGEAVARHHVDALVAGMDPPLTDDERATLERDLHIVGDDRPVNLLRDTAELAQLMAGVRPTLVVLDPISSLIGGEDENSEQVAQAVCDNLRRDIGRPLGAAILFAGHLRKPGREGGEATTVHDLKGSAGWANHARVVWLVSKPKGGTTITFKLAKSNRLQTGLEHHVTLAIEANPDNAAHWLTARLTDANIGASSQSFTPGVGRSINDNERKALEALDDRHEPGLRLSYSAWFKRSGLTAERTFKNVRERLLDAELAAAIPTGKKARNGSTEYAYAITDGGRAALATGWNRD